MSYQSRLTWESLLTYEMQTVARLLLDGKSWSEIRKELIYNNLFQYEKESSVKKRYGLIKRRFSYITEEWWSFFVTNSNKAKILTLYTICADSILFLDFLRLTIYEKYRKRNLTLYKSDVTAFLDMLSNQGAEVQHWTLQTKKKVEQVVLKILKESELLVDDKLQSIYIDSDLKKYLMNLEIWPAFISYLQN